MKTSAVALGYRKLHSIPKGIPLSHFGRKNTGGLGASEVHRLRQLEEENLRFKRLVADLTLVKSILQEV